MAEVRDKRSFYLIKSFEAQAAKKRPFSIKLADIFTSQFGTLTFLVVNIIFFVVWIYINNGHVKWIGVFDPYPYIFLTMTVSLEAIVLSIIVLISQNRENQMNSLRQDLQLQVNLIAEREITKVLKLLKEIREEIKKDCETDVELDDMTKNIDAGYIERKLQEQLVNSDKPITEITEIIKETINSKK
jgi:uncharacterized membrane protein